MKSFLEIVASDIICRYGTQLNRIAVVFPNKRASLFLNDALARIAQKPIWSPAYITISDLFRQNSSLSVGDPIRLICLLYQCFKKITDPENKSEETLDHFYGWGQLLISDFDDIDKNMAQAHDVFRNLRDYHEYDELTYLSAEQKELLKRFFDNFSEDQDSRLKERFLRLWNNFSNIYDEFRQSLRSKGIAYEGMLYRDVAEQENLNFSYDYYLFIGFNMMQKVEKTICKRLQQQGKAKFYWDFDNYYMQPGNEAGHYLRELLQLFPNELDKTNSDIFDHFADENKQISFVSAPTENIQARYINDWLKQDNRIEDGRQTAIILCDEHLLPSVIHCLPNEVNNVNVTTGYPLSDTLIASFVMHLSRYKSASHPTPYMLRRIKRHPYYSFLDDNIFNEITNTNLEFIEWLQNQVKRIAIRLSKTESENQMQNESLFRMYTLLNRLNTITKSGELDANRNIILQLIQQLIQTTSIPFHGEPAAGLQIMGVLESRNLDFRHVLLLSCNEGKLPKGVNDASFIPYAIRKAYGLTTVDNKVAIFSYYFHSLLQRATDITICYNNSTDDGHTGEMSRFMLQLFIEYPHKVNRVSLKSGQKQILLQPKTRTKDDDIMQALNKFTSLSPSAINRYMRCPLQFYYCYILGLREPNETEEGEIDDRLFGNIFHRAAQLLYDQLGKNIRQEMLNHLLRNPEQIEVFVDHALADEMPNLPINRLNGLQIIKRQVIISYLERLLQIDEQLAPFYIIGNEEKVYTSITFTTSQGNRTIRIGGSIDRLDQVNDPQTGEQSIRVIDYKTGSKLPKKEVGEFAEIFNPENIRDKHTDYYLQTMIYSYIVSNDRALNPQNLPVKPGLLFIQRTKMEDYDPTIKIYRKKVSDIREYATELQESLEKLIAEIFEPQNPFTPTVDRRHCVNCSYRQLCGL
ncbi:MAG: PD-(D/E)XK nuclease family protein [Prevotella sp.]|nr:PD-(D/E)XK nuclease family protein [Prevotella sp.]